jgi:hypothetical protein
MALAKVEQAIHNSQRNRVDYSQPIQLLILPTTSLPTGVLWQTQGVLEWLHLPHSPTRVITPYHSIVAKLIVMGRFHMVYMVGLEPSIIYNIILELIKWLRTILISIVLRNHEKNS